MSEPDDQVLGSIEPKHVRTTRISVSKSYVTNGHWCVRKDRLPGSARFLKSQELADAAFAPMFDGPLEDYFREPPVAAATLERSAKKWLTGERSEVVFRWTPWLYHSGLGRYGRRYESAAGQVVFVDDDYVSLYGLGDLRAASSGTDRSYLRGDGFAVMTMNLDSSAYGVALSDLLPELAATPRTSGRKK